MNRAFTSKTREGIQKHQAVFMAWLNGDKIERRNKKTGAWVLTHNPAFVSETEYRVYREPREYWLTMEVNGMEKIHRSLKEAQEYIASNVFNGGFGDCEIMQVREVRQ